MSTKLDTYSRVQVCLTLHDLLAAEPMLLFLAFICAAAQSSHSASEPQASLILSSCTTRQHACVAKEAAPQVYDIIAAVCVLTSQAAVTGQHSRDADGRTAGAADCCVLSRRRCLQRTGIVVGTHAAALQVMHSIKRQRL